MKSLYNPRDHQALRQRLESLRPDSPRQWGRMSPHQAVCHLLDAFRLVLGERDWGIRPGDPTPDTFVNRTVGRLYALTLPLPWPKGLPTSRAADQERGGTPPGDFADDVAELEAAMDRFRDHDGRNMSPHIVFRQLTRGEWGRWGYRHMDHHLRQFGA